MFYKADTSMCGPNDDVIQPPESTKLDWEVEIALVIGSKLQYADEQQAKAAIAARATAPAKTSEGGPHSPSV